MVPVLRPFVPVSRPFVPVSRPFLTDSSQYHPDHRRITCVSDTDVIYPKLVSMPQPESTPLPKLPVKEMAPFEYRIIPAPHFCPVLVLRQPPDNPGSLSVPWVKMFLAPTWVVCFLSQFGFFVLEDLAADWLALDWLKLTHMLWV